MALQGFHHWLHLRLTGADASYSAEQDGIFGGRLAPFGGEGLNCGIDGFLVRGGQLPKPPARDGQGRATDSASRCWLQAFLQAISGRQHKVLPKLLPQRGACEVLHQQA